MDPDFGGPGFGGLLDNNFEAIFMVVATLVVLGVVFVFGSIIWGVVGNARRAVRNNAAPEVAAVAEVVDKRVALSGGGTTRSAGLVGPDGSFAAGTISSTPIHTTHFVTFEQSGGTRFELEVPEYEYGMLVVGDSGTVTMKGTRYLGFQRELLR